MKRIYATLFLAFAWVTCAAAALDLNTATVKDLQSINGVGPDKAKAIVEFREMHGKFKSFNDVTKVRGIDSGTVEKIKKDTYLDHGDTAYGNVPDPCRINPNLPQCFRLEK